MKYFTMSLALLAVVAMANVSTAGMLVDCGEGIQAGVSDPIDLDFGKVAYEVTMYGTQAWRGIWIDIPVHQVFAGVAGTQTPYLGDLPGSVPPTKDPTPYDTHFLFAAGDMSVGQQVDKDIETCSKANENGLTDDYMMYAGVVKTGHPGMGTFDARGTAKDLAFAFTGDIPAEGYPWLYVVLEEGARGYLYCQAANAAATVQVACEIPIGIPEPGTIVMLIAGALCLLGIRRK